ESVLSNLDAGVSMPVEDPMTLEGTNSSPVEMMESQVVEDTNPVSVILEEYPLLIHLSKSVPGYSIVFTEPTESAHFKESRPVMA
ncbi:hypothetical protein AMTR_s00038p00227750, partial [Amborella trichopoda]